MMNFSFLTTCWFLYLISFDAYDGKDTPALIPEPTKVEWQKGHFQLSKNTSIIGSTQELRTYFTDRLGELTGLVVKSNNKATKNQIILKTESQPDSANAEAYSLNISKQKVQITANGAEGLFRGIQTFLQLIPASAKSEKNYNIIQIPCCIINDQPKFKWRGLNLDCARHFMSKDFIKRYIDILAYYKFNRLHWHLTEDQGWRIEIKKYPMLTETGAWRKEADGSIYGGFYTQEDIKEIVSYAQERFITIVPEIELPGHSLASLASYPENSCSGGPFEVTNMWGVMKDIYCAGRDSTFLFLQNILDEVTTLFPGKYIHIGGDEAPKDRWKACPKCQARIKNEGLQDEDELQSYFIKRIARYLDSKNKTIIGWDEILDGGLAEGAIVQSWRSFQGAIDAAKLGHYTISSPASHTYLNHDPDDLDLRIAYSFQPVPDALPDDQKKYVIGSEANLWTEHAPQETVDSKLFPRLLALAEVFWNDPQNKDYETFHNRVQKAYEDLRALGIEYGRETKVITTEIDWDKKEKAFSISVKKGQKDITVRYTLDGSEPDSSSQLYTTPIKINTTASLRISAFRNNYFFGAQYALNIILHKALGAKLNLTNPYDERYRASGENGLIDGVRGSSDLHDGLWQGFEGVDFEAVIDLGEEMEISRVKPTFLLDANSWVFLPEKVTISVGRTPGNFMNEQILENDVPQKNSEIVLKDFCAEFEAELVQYIRVQAKSIKKCPSWHPGAGGPAWLFIDEIVVE